MASKVEAEIERVNRLSSAALAEMVMQDAQLLRERAADRGVTAYLDKPVHRERPNERFLQSTLRNGNSSNRRAQERTMWNARNAQLELEHGGRHRAARRSRSRSPPHTVSHASGFPVNGTAGAARGSKRQRSGHNAVSGRGSRRSVSPASSCRSDSGSDSLQSGHSAGDGSQAPDGPSVREAALEAERKLEELLSKSRVRGRGAVGSRADEPGPYLPAPAAGVYSDDDDDRAAPARPMLGPLAPAWARNGSAAAQRSSSAFVAALHAANLASSSASVRSPVEATPSRKKAKLKRQKASSKKKAKQKHKHKRERDDG